MPNLPHTSKLGSGMDLYNQRDANASRYFQTYLRQPCGKIGIRTLETVTRLPHFECGAIDHSAIFPIEIKTCFLLQWTNNAAIDKQILQTPYECSKRTNEKATFLISDCKGTAFFWIMQIFFVFFAFFISISPLKAFYHGWRFEKWSFLYLKICTFQIFIVPLHLVFIIRYFVAAIKAKATISYPNN